MTSSTHSTSSRSPSQACIDPIDMDSFINYEAISYQSPSISPTTSRSQPALIRTNSTTTNPNNTLLPPNHGLQNVFAGPSHQYESYKQQTGLPSGALSSTFAVNPPSNSNMFRSNRLGLASTGFDFNDTSFDFGVMPISDTDMDFDMGSDLFLNPSRNSSSDFVDPSALGGLEEKPMPEMKPVPSQPSNVGRLYPGAHQQQAAMLKAQQAQQAQAQAQARQSMSQQQQPAKPRSRRPASSQTADPIVEEKISQLLKSMRQSSVATSNSDDDDLALNGGHAHAGRLRKDEEDMDEDERLLASEEGKKLSSKERRQLRNKVSARAFRSRRKEYIGQLEAEIAEKANEASSLKRENKALQDENTRLTDLTRMLLSSPAFSTFLDNMSTESIQTAQTTQSEPEPQPQQQQMTVQPTLNKDVNPYGAQQQPDQDQNIGMALIPENTIDFTNLGVANTWNTWGATTQPQVFSVLEVPQGPPVESIDTTALSGKSSSSGFISSFESKFDAPVIERLPVVEEETVEESKPTVASNLPELDSSFDLYADSPKSTIPATTLPSAPLAPSKVSFHLAVVSTETDEPAGEEVSALAMERFHIICEQVQNTLDRVGRNTSHL